MSPLYPSGCPVVGGASTVTVMGSDGLLDQVQRAFMVPGHAVTVQIQSTEVEQGLWVSALSRSRPPLGRLLMVFFDAVTGHISGAEIELGQ